MPNRILKESICTSDNLNELTEEEENFFYRLLVCCDDHGRFDGRPAILKARCYPLKDKTYEQIAGYLARLQEKHIISVYQVDGKEYIQILTWENHQQIRAKKSKFPAPVCNLQSSDIICNQSQENVPVIQSNPNPIRIQSESKAEIPYEQIRMSYNKFCKSFPAASSMTPERMTLIRALWHKYEAHDGGPIRFFDQLFRQVQSSDFLKESIKKGQRWCNFEWILDPSHAVKIIEGAYENGDPRNESEGKDYDFDTIMKGVR